MSTDVRNLLERSLRDIHAHPDLAERVITRQVHRRHRRRIAGGVGTAVLAAAAGLLTWAALGTSQQAGQARVIPAGTPQAPPPSVPDGSLIPGAQREPAPALAGTTVAGKPLTVNLQRGAPQGQGTSITVVNFCGAWNAQCRAEQKVFASIGSASAGGLGVTVIGVDEDDTPAAISAYVHDVDVTYPVIVDDGRLAQAWDPGVSVPITVVVDGKGLIAARFVGPVTRDPLAEVIKKLAVEEQPPETKGTSAVAPQLRGSRTFDLKEKAAKRAAAAKPETSKGTVPSLPQKSPAQTPATKTAPPVKP